MNKDLNIVTKKAKALHTSVMSMINDGMHRYDPARFHYIQTLCNRALHAPMTIADILCTKVLKASNQYKSDLNISLKEAAVWIDKAILLSPENKSMLNTLLQRYEIRLAQQKARKIVQQHMAKDKPSLTTLFMDNNTEFVADQSMTIENPLLHHEIVVKKLLSNRNHTGSKAEGYHLSDLKSYHLFRESSVKMYTEHILSQSIDQLPEDTGPLNSHKLAVKSIQIMQDISPAYLRKFISYMDTLFWLDEVTKVAVKKGKPR